MKLARLMNTDEFKHEQTVVNYCIDPHTHTHTHRGKQTALSQLQKRLNQCHVQTQVILTDMDQSVVWAV